MQYIGKDENFEKLLNDNVICIVKFWAPWCGPCRGLKPIIDQISTKYKDIAFIDINVDESQLITTKYLIRSVPTILFIKNKKIEESFVGIRSLKQIEDVILNIIK